MKVDIGTRFHFRSFLIDFDEKYWSNGSKIWAGGIHPSPAYTSTKKPGQIRVKRKLVECISGKYRRIIHTIDERKIQYFIENCIKKKIPEILIMLRLTSHKSCSH